jgi:hypothetical protein
MTAPARDCVTCKHWDEGETGWIAPRDLSTVFRVIVVNGSGFWYACAMHHKPKFYQPRYPGDFYWGWKRRCADYEPREGEE